MRNIKDKTIRILITINLFILALFLLGKIHLIKKIIFTIAKAFLIPLLISVLIFYILRPLNNIFIRKGMGKSKSSILTLCIFTFILSGFFSYFSKYAYEEFLEVSKQIWITINDKKQINSYIGWIDKFIDLNEIYKLILSMVKSYVQQIGFNFMKVIGYFMNTFSFVFLIIVIVYYMLKDGDKFKERVLYFIPKKYKDISSEIITESDVILSHYVTGQAKVALCLSIMIYAGYKFIGIPNGFLLATITFILAFIPFVGFFISMIIPIVISLSMGIFMFLKLMAVFIIVQTLKGRIVVPAIMAKSMNIHPLTDIFLVILAIALGGPFFAFAVVPVYAIIKNAIKIFKKAQ